MGKNIGKEYCNAPSSYKRDVQEFKDPRQDTALDNLTETSDLVKTMTVSVSLSHHLSALDLDMAFLFLGAQLAIAAPVLCGTRFGVFPFARLSDAAGDFVGTGRDDGSVVIRVGVCGAGDGGEEGVGWVAIPARGWTHGAGVGSPWTDWADTGVSVLVLT